MRNTSGDAIIVKYSHARHLYEQVARELHRILDEDPRFPMQAVYTVKHRFKNDRRLLEKIRDLNSKSRKGVRRINESTFQERIEDLLGIRIVCLRLSDQDRLKTYIESLRKEKALRIVKGPTEITTFRVKPGGKESGDLQYSGYSSTHYVVRLGPRLRVSTELASLKAELQLRTIFEEAWGEIDHKYQYEKTRAGGRVPTSISNGFRDLALYLLACSRQADHLCEEVEQLPQGAPSSTAAGRRRSKKPRLIEPPAKTQLAPTEPAPAKTLEQILRGKLGFVPSDRTLAYCDRRLQEHGYFVGGFTPEKLGAALTDDVLKRFKEIFYEELDKQPFVDVSERDMDVVPLVNYTIFRYREIT